MKALVLVLCASLLIACGGTFRSVVAPGYEAPAGEQIAVTYLDHPDINISNEATQVLEEQMAYCEIKNFLTAEKVQELLEKNNTTLPKRLTQNSIQALKEALPAKYLITGGVTKWQKGGVRFPVALDTEVGASLTMYDLATGKVVWTISGEEKGSGGLFAEDSKTKAKTVFKKMLSKWKGFCQPTTAY